MSGVWVEAEALAEDTDADCTDDREVTEEYDKCGVGKQRLRTGLLDTGVTKSGFPTRTISTSNPSHRNN